LAATGMLGDQGLGELMGKRCDDGIGPRLADE
jgi:hypothetical protein